MNPKNHDDLEDRTQDEPGTIRAADDDLELGDPTRRRYSEAEYEEAARNAAITINKVVNQRQECIEALLRVIRDPRRGANVAGEMLRKIKAKEGVWA